MTGDDRKTIMVSKEIHELLKTIDSSPSKAIDKLLKINSEKSKSNANAMSSILLELNEVQDLIEKLVKLNGLRTN